MATNDSNLMLIVEAARILEQNGQTSNHSGHNGLNGYSQSGSTPKRNKRMKSLIAQAPTTVEVTDLDAYEVNILKEDNPFAKEDGEDEEDDEDDSNNHSPCFKFPKLKFQNAKPISHAKQVHNDKEKQRRKTLKQAQLSLHKVLHPHSHQKPVLRIILCNAIREIKVEKWLKNTGAQCCSSNCNLKQRLKTEFKENENYLAVLKERRTSLTSQLEILKSLGIPQDHSPGDRTDDKDDDSSRPESVDSESFLDVVEAEDLFDQTAQDVSINEEDSTKQTQENDSLANANITEIPSTANQSSAVFSSSYIPQAQLYYYTQLLGCTTLLQSMQINSYLNGGNLWLPPYLWPNLSALNSPTGTNMPVNLSVEALNEASIHQATLVCTPPVKCSVVKTIGSIDSDRTSHHESLNQNSAAFFCRQLC